MPSSLHDRLTSLVGTSATSDPFGIDRAHLEQFGRSTYLSSDDVDLTISENNVLGPDLVDGFMLLSVLMHFEFARPLVDLEGAYGFNYGLDRVRFTHPVMVGEQIRYHRGITDVDEKTPTRFVITSENTVELYETNTVAMHAVWKTMLIDGRAEAA